MDTISTALRRADKTTLTSTKLIDARFAGLPAVDRVGRGSAGMILAKALLDKASARSAGDMLDHIKATKKDVNAAFAAAESDIQSAEVRRDAYRDAIKYLSGDITNPPSNLGEAFKSALIALRSARAIAPNCNASLEAELGNLITAADGRINHHKELIARQKASASLGVTKQARAYVENNMRELQDEERATMAVWLQKAKATEKRQAVAYNMKRGLARGGK